MKCFKTVTTAIMMASTSYASEELLLVDVENYNTEKIATINFCSPPQAPTWVTPVKVETDAIKVEKIKTADGWVLDMKVSDTELGNPGILLPPPPGMRYWDLSKYEHLYADVENMSDDQQAALSVRITNPLVGNYQIANNSGIGLNPGEKRTLELYYPQADEFTKCKMEGICATPPGIPGKKNVDGKRVDAIVFFTANPLAHVRNGTMHVRISNIRLAKPYQAPTAPVNDPEKFYPFVDKYGQYKYLDWPEKIHSDADFARMAEQEKALLNPRIATWNKWGGWAEGPTLKATGFFRAEKYKDKWFLVDPDGKLFFSFGINAVTMGEGRTSGGKLPDNWFETKRLNPSGWNFDVDNLTRKYGKNYRQGYPDIVAERFQSWGINTLGNWSSMDFIRNQRTPYTTEILRASNCPRTTAIAGFKGVVDPFSEQFKASLRKNATSDEMQAIVNDPWCIGLFINNELVWGDRTAAARSSMASPSSLSAKTELVKYLREKYLSVVELNKKWGTSYKDWDAVLNSQDLPDADKSFEDMLAFNRRFMTQYYSTCRDVVKEFFPNTLYLGSRIHIHNHELYEVAAKYCDVVAMNVYAWSMDGLRRSGLPADKPIMVTEFHVAVLDRGMFNADLRPAGITQDDRAHAFLRLMQGMLLHPQILGAHYFCYRNQPVTGRWGGPGQENFAIGVIDQCDTPYWELTSMMRKISENMMQYRIDGKYECNWDK